ncbi:MAG TPA: winged helix-turn-helix domain-containing protein [Candidatus Dormibacteraeota bacterium]|nr:winged helix-turn-helix domain-containing protein [Candidatus Dormibacteraeota bacterium]
MAEHCTVPELISTHGLILLCIASNNGLSVSRLAALAGVSERTASRTISDLVEAGYVTRTRHGTRNSYTVQPQAEVSDPVGQGWRLERLLGLSHHTVDEAPRQPA